MLTSLRLTLVTHNLLKNLVPYKNVRKWSIYKKKKKKSPYECVGIKALLTKSLLNKIEVFFFLLEIFLFNW